MQPSVDAAEDVSVVIPVLDDARHLRHCLARIAAQSMRPREVIVVDNGSRDDSAQVALAAGAVLLQEPVPGVPAAAARGYDAARGAIIARCDADSRVPRDWIARVHSAFTADPLLDGLTGPGRFYDLHAAWAPLAGFAYGAGALLGAGAAMASVPLWGSNMAVRREAWLRVAHAVERQDPGLHDDFDLTMQLGPTARIRFDPQLVVGVEGRLFHTRADASRRIRMAMRTYRINWSVGGGPGERWLQRLGMRPTPGRGAAGSGGDQRASGAELEPSIRARP